MKRIMFFLFFYFVFLFSCQHAFAACGSCSMPLESNQIKDSNQISSGAMVNSPTASTLGKNHSSVGFSFDHVRFNTIPAEDAHMLHEEGRDIHGKNHEETYNMHVGYGLTDNWDIYLTAPIVSKTFIQVMDHDNLGRGENSVGFGDMKLITKYRFWERFLEAAVIGAIKFPTGETDHKDQSGMKIEAEQQSGSGSWDGEFGLALSRSFKKRISIATSFQYALRGEGAQERKFGDLFIYNVGSSFALRELGKYPNVSLVLEMNNKWALRDHSREQDQVYDSGGNTLFLSPGFTADLTKNLSTFWAMPIPMSQNMGGEHEELKYELITGVNWHF